LESALVEVAHLNLQSITSLPLNNASVSQLKFAEFIVELNAVDADVYTAIDPGTPDKALQTVP